MGADRIHLNSECTGYTRDDKGVSIRLADGHSDQGDLLIGADGFHSVIRRQLFGPESPRYAGYVAWRCVVSFAHACLSPGKMIFALGRGAQVGVMHIGRGLVYWFTTTPVILTRQRGLHALQ